MDYVFNYGYQCGGYYPSDYAMLNDIAEYIHDELSDSRYYAILATKAPTQRAKNLLLEFSKDEKTHAENFMKVYYTMTGNNYVLPEIAEPTVPDYMEAIKIRILAETGDYEKYGIKYLQAVNRCLKDLFFMTRTKEAQHAMRFPLLIAEK
jgi:rubrerythrin